MKIGIDYDGTMARTQDVIAALMNFKHNTTYTAKDIRDWDFWQSQGLSNDFWRIYDLFDNTTLRRSILPYDLYLAPVIQQLMETHEIVVVTANEPKCVKTIQNWIASNVHTHIPVIAIGRGPMVRKLNMGLDLLIDDSPDIGTASSNLPRILMNTKWNENIPDSPLVRRARTWLHVPEIVDSFSTII